MNERESMKTPLSSDMAPLICPYSWSWTACTNRWNSIRPRGRLRQSPDKDVKECLMPHYVRNGEGDISLSLSPYNSHPFRRQDKALSSCCSAGRHTTPDTCTASEIRPCWEPEDICPELFWKHVLPYEIHLTPHKTTKTTTMLNKYTPQVNIVQVFTSMCTQASKNISLC